jgi:hypothetical protein
MWKKINGYRVLMGKPAGKRHLENESLILKCVAAN